MLFHHQKLSTWYHQLAQQLEAGLLLTDAFRTSRGAGAPAAVLEKMARAIEAGETVDDALRVAADWMPETDRLLLVAAAGAGRMPRTLHVLSTQHQQLGAAKLRVLFACLYPTAVLHLALALWPVVRMIDWDKGFAWDPVLYVRGLAFTLLPLWLVLGIVAWLARRPGPVFTRLTRMIPIVGRYLRLRALSDFSFALGNVLEAGVSIDQAWELVGELSPDPALRSAALKLRTVIQSGHPPGPHLARFACFPPEFVALYRTGEEAGQLETNLQRLAQQNHEQAQRALTLATVVYPGVMFVAVAIGVGYFVISIYGGYLKMLTNLAGS